MSFDAYLEGIHPEDRDQVAEVVGALLASPDSLVHQYRIVRPDGSERWVEARIRSRVDHQLVTNAVTLPEEVRTGPPATAET